MPTDTSENQTNEPSWFSFGLAWLIFLVPITLPMILIAVALVLFAEIEVMRWGVTAVEVLISALCFWAMLAVSMRMIRRKLFEPRFIRELAINIQPFVDTIEKG